MSSFRPIFFDLETTGIRPEKDRIIEIAAIDPYQKRTFQTLVNPLIAISIESQEIHGISDAMVEQAPIFPAAANAFIQFCQEIDDTVVLIAHNGEAFDIPFLSAEFSRHNLILPTKWAFVDSLKWARKYRRDLPKHSLQYLRQIFGLPENQAHRALDDVETLYKVFSLLADDLDYEEIIEKIDGYRSLESFQKKYSNSQRASSGIMQPQLENAPYSLF